MFLCLASKSSHVGVDVTGRLDGADDARLALRVHQVLALEEAVDAANLELEAGELLVHVGALRLYLGAHHL
jgi:hypothetical protein